MPSVNTVIVAIGSSAGGLEALVPFFDATPHDSATYIVLRHLPINCISRLGEILSRHCDLRFLEATNGMKIQKDKIYLPPPSMYMTVKEDTLFLHKRINNLRYPNYSFNIFLDSLAIDKGENCIAVILSGAGNDGTKGASAIKHSGGLVIAQTPSSCQFPSMPSNAIATGNVDHIMLPAEMSATILQYTNARLRKQSAENKSG